VGYRFGSSWARSRRSVIRHAPGASAQIKIDVDRAADSLVLTIVNSAPADRPPPEPAGVEQGSDSRTRLGLIGMRQRANLLRGTLAHGPRPVGGFEVTTSLPLHQARSTIEGTADSNL